jgi:hypothetical protein
LIESIDVHTHTRTHAQTHTHTLSLSQLLGHVHFNTNGIDTKSVAAFAIRYFWRRTHFVPSDATLDDHLDTTIQAVPPVPIQPPQQYWRAPVLFDRVVATRHRPARHQVPQTPNALRQPTNQSINRTIGCVSIKSGHTDVTEDCCCNGAVVQAILKSRAEATRSATTASNSQHNHQDST